MDMGCLIHANENFKNEIWDLREVAANLDVEKQEIMAENRSLKEQNKILEAKIDCFKAMAEDFCKEEEELHATLSQVEETIGQMESQNQALKETNETLRTEIQNESGHVVFFQDYKAIQEQDLSRMKEVMENIGGYFRNLESKIEIAERLYKEEKVQVAELTHTLGELEQIQEVQENEIVSLRDQLEEASLLRPQMDDNTKAPSLLHEMVQAKLMQDSLAMQNGILFLLSKLVWLLLMAVVCLAILSLSAKFYVFVYNQDLETGGQLLLYSDRSLQLLLEVLSPHSARKPSGLLPF